MSSILKTVNLKKYFKTKNGNLHAVDNINIEIRKGETLGIVGESGCGKSTLGRTLLKFHEPTDGAIYFNGEEISEYSKRRMMEIRKKMQIIFQDPFSSLDPRMVVFDIIAEPLRELKKIRSKKVLEEKVFNLMKTVGLSEGMVSAYPHELDGGKRQRVGIARALAIEPEFIVCDEPVSALDVSIQAQILNLLMDIQEERELTYVFITHDLSVVKHISDRIAVMYLGEIIEIAESKQLFENPLHPYTKALLESIPRAKYVENKKRMEVIKGEITSPIEPKAGCRFAPRCNYATDICQKENVSLKEMSKGHEVACVLYKNVK